MKETEGQKKARAEYEELKAFFDTVTVEELLKKSAYEFSFIRSQYAKYNRLKTVYEADYAI